MIIDIEAFVDQGKMEGGQKRGALSTRPSSSRSVGSGRAPAVSRSSSNSTATYEGVRAAQVRQFR